MNFHCGKVNAVWIESTLLLLVFCASLFCCSCWGYSFFIVYIFCFFPLVHSFWSWSRMQFWSDGKEYVADNLKLTLCAYTILAFPVMRVCGRARAFIRLCNYEFKPYRFVCAHTHFRNNATKMLIPLLDSNFHIDIESFISDRKYPFWIRFELQRYFLFFVLSFDLYSCTILHVFWMLVSQLPTKES